MSRHTDTISINALNLQSYSPDLNNQQIPTVEHLKKKFGILIGPISPNRAIIFHTVLQKLIVAKKLEFLTVESHKTD